MKRVFIKSLAYLLCILILIIFQPHKVLAASLSAVSSPAELTELTLNDAVIQLTLMDDAFKPEITAANFDLVNEPSGTTIQSVTFNSTTSASITLAFTGQDFDGDKTNFYIKAFKTGLVSNSTDLSSNFMVIRSVTENITASTNPDPLTETTLNGSSIVITLYGDTFINDLTTNNFSLHVPAGMGVLGISRIQRLSDTQVQIDLSYDGLDFDADKTDFRIKVSKAVLVRTTTDLETPNITIYCALEGLNVVNTTPNPLIETELNGSVITLDVVGDQYVSDISILDFQLRNPPSGLIIVNLDRISDTEVKLTLSFNGTDFDADITNFRVKLFKQGLERTASDLESSDMTILAVKEGTPGITASSSPTQLYETSLDGSTINLTVREDEFQSTLVPSYFQLNNAPAGTSILSISYINSFNVNLKLAFNGTDFDTDITGFSVTALPSSLKSGTSLTSNTLSIKAVKEIEGQGDYIMTGESFPTNIQVAGYNIHNNELYLNIELTTGKTIQTGQSAVYYYFIEVFDNTGSLVGHVGSIEQPVSVSGADRVQLKNTSVTLNNSMPTQLRIVVSIEQVIIQ